MKSLIYPGMEVSPKVAGKFNPRAVDDLLVQCHRRCCICHRFCGSKIETDHIEQRGSNEIDNAILVCFECHAEIHSYNDQHPRGRKFHPEELRKHKEQWLRLCVDRPEMFIGASWDADVGPLQALIDELEFNLAIANSASFCPFLDNEFLRAIREGAISTLKQPLKDTIIAAYVAIGKANRTLDPAVLSSNGLFNAGGVITDNIRDAKPKIQEAWKALLEFLSSED